MQLRATLDTFSIWEEELKRQQQWHSKVQYAILKRYQAFFNDILKKTALIIYLPYPKLPILELKFI